MKKAVISFFTITVIMLWAHAGTGTATTGMPAERVRPVKTQGFAGNLFTVAVREDGTLWTWG